MIHRYRWVATGRSFSCVCGGGRVREYRVEPPRSKVYINVISVCDNPDCTQAVVHEGTERERRGRFILA